MIEDESPEDPDILGSFFGYPHGRADSSRARLPAKIVDLPASARGGVSPTPPSSSTRSAITVLHELAHYFGIDEDRIAELGYQ